MSVRFTELHCKEVITLCNGQRLGYISDVRIELPEGQVVAIVVPGPGRFFGILGRRDDYVIPWRCVRNVGPDIVLVDAKPDECRVCRNKFGFWNG